MRLSYKNPSRLKEYISRIRLFNCTLFLISLTSGLFMGCAGPGLHVTVLRPAEINLKDFDKIAVVEIEGNGGKRFFAELTQALREKSERLEVLNRKSLKMAIGENNPSGGIALISGKIYEDYDEDLTHRDVEKKDKKTGKVKTTRWYSRKGTARVKVSLRIVDFYTSRVLASRKYDESKSTSTSESDRRPSSIDDTGLLETCRKRIIRSFLQVVLPYFQRVRVSFEIDEDMPELARGLKMAKSGNWDASFDIFERITKTYPNSPVVYKAYYNLGLAYMYTDKFDQARTALEEAYARRPGKKYQKALTKLNIRIEDKRRLKEQGILNP